MKRSKFANWLFAKIGAWLQHEEPPRHAYMSDFDRITYEIRPGDVLLLEGRHRVSNIIRRVTLRFFNAITAHYGLYCFCQYFPMII